MMIKDSTTPMSCFDSRPQEKKDAFQREYAVYEEELANVNAMLLIELKSCKNSIEQDRVYEKYSKILSYYADCLLEEDAKKSRKAVAKPSIHNLAIPLTEKVKEIIVANREKLLQMRFIKTNTNPAVCVITGKKIRKGDIFLRMKGEGESALLSACDDSVVVNSDCKVFIQI